MNGTQNKVGTPTTQIQQFKLNVKLQNVLLISKSYNHCIIITGKWSFQEFKTGSNFFLLLQNSEMLVTTNANAF